MYGAAAGSTPKNPAEITLTMGNGRCRAMHGPAALGAPPKRLDEAWLTDGECELRRLCRE